MTVTTPPATDRFWRLRHLPPLLAVSAVVALLAAVVGALTGGGTAAVGAPIGVAVVTLSYTVTTVMLAWADTVDPRLILPFGLTLYVTKLTLLGVVMMAVAAADWPGLVPLCVGIAVGVVGWTGAHIWWLTATRRDDERARSRDVGARHADGGPHVGTPEPRRAAESRHADREPDAEGAGTRPAGAAARHAGTRPDATAGVPDEA